MSAMPQPPPAGGSSNDIDKATLTTREPVELSVIVPAYFGATTIVECLESVHRATAGRRREIIVVESSGDATADIVRARFPEVVVICPEQRLSAGGARNRGVAAARGQLVFFVDQDCVVPPDWIGRLERHLAGQGVGAAGGSVGIQELANLSGCAVYFLEFLYHFPGTGPSTRDRNFLVGCNSAFRIDALRSVRFPDQTLGEDVLLSHEVQTNGFGVVYDPSIEVRHYNRHGWAEFFRYNRKMGAAAAHYHGLLRRKWVRPFLAMPVLLYLAPAVILPGIAVRLARSRWSYFFCFLLLSPMCVAGNLAWAHAFRRRVLAQRTDQADRRGAH